MKLYYVTLNNTDEARQIGRALLEQKLAVCVNWFPITCAYSWQGEITEELEIVLIVKTQDGYGAEIEELIRQHINYTNFIAEISPSAINQGFLGWLNAEVPQRTLQTNS
ncbi:cytochrome C biogenesis protein CcdA [Nostoc minutum NIES-26]|uniref:Cytochrome C biogenesis protein CcdA n=1 Tax=Nostoc minutum NIES-26 TaxID=1844469 RepID=A0A367R3L9_9NOSO|nr:divalent-cation tolerance protein CutA [Dendronalium sp. ChiSLP03b]MDZ8203286.1 divalent-cation tolerance protein CutA [Dendronalium sp. ChiSLP03b]RCJ30032.1 cytochrome C biogenesis protein CcdA [Nostoc minutum NIES-26]